MINGSSGWVNTSYSNFAWDRNTNNLILPDNDTDGLVLYHKMSGSSGITSYNMNLTSDNNGTLTNMNTGLDNGSSGWNSSGKYGNAIAFDGVNDYIDAGSDESLNITGAITVEAWVESSVFSTTFQGIYTQNENENDLKNVQIYTRTSAGAMVLFNVLNETAGSRKYISVGNLINNKLTHIVCVWDGEDILTVYIDGVAYTEASTNEVQARTYGNTYFGYSSNAGTVKSTNGIIDSIRIYNRALSNDEINQTMNNTMVTSINFTHWHDAGAGYVIPSFIVNMTGEINYTVEYADNASDSWTQIGGYYTANSTPEISGTTFQDTDARITLYGNGTTTPEYVEITFVTEAAPEGAAPNITSWQNNKTVNDTLDFTINTSEEVIFNATANQTIVTWNWYKDNADQSNNYDNITLNWSAAGLKHVVVNATNANGTSASITWNVTVESIIPTVSLLSQTPSLLYQNTTGTFNMSWGITHGVIGLNNTSVSMIYTLYDFLHSNYNTSLRYPSNNRSALDSITGEYILRKDNRNDSLNFEDNATITGGNIYQWAGADENTTRLSIVPVNDTYTIVNWNGTIQDTVSGSTWYLDRSEQENAVMTGHEINKFNHVLIQTVMPLHDALHTNQLLDIYIDSFDGGLNPIKLSQIYYLNNSYDPLGAVNPEDSPYAFLITTKNATQWFTDDYVVGNSSYSNSVTLNLSDVISNGILPTSKFYIYIDTEAATTRSYWMNKTNSDTSTNLTFGETESMWIGDGAPFTAHAYTPNIFITSRSNNTQFKTNLYVADNNGVWANAGIQTTNISLSEYPPTTPSINHFHTSEVDYDMNGTYNGVFDIGIGVASDPDGGVVTHNLTLHYDNETFAAIINNTFTNGDITHNGVFADIEFNSIPYYSDDWNYTLKVVATDDEGESIDTWLNVNFTLQDTAPPASITGLTNDTSILFYHNWSWTNPVDSDFNGTMIYINGIFVSNVTNTTTFYNFSVSAHNESTISTHTFDLTGNINSTWVNHTSIIPNNAPTLSGLPDNSTNEDTDLIGAFDLDDYFVDADSDTPTYQVQSNDQSGDVTVTIQGDNTVDYTLSANWNGVANIVFNVTDGYGGTDSDAIILTVTAVNDTPVMDAIGDQSVNEGSLLTIDVNATDVETDTLYYDTNFTLGSMDHSTGIFTWTPNYIQSGIYSVLFNVTDNNTVDSEIITITVNNIPLSIDSYWNNITGESLTLSASVNDSIEFGVTTNRSAENISWYRDTIFAENDSTTAQGNYTTSWAIAGIYEVNVTAFNNSEQTANTTFVITISAADTSAPSITNLTNSTPSSSTVTITWDTNETANSFVCYGLNETTVNDWSGCTNSSWTNSTSSISIGLTGLTSNTTYYYKPYSEDTTGNANTSVAAQNFTTASITETYVPLSIFTMWSVIMLISASLSFMLSGIYGISSSLLTVMIAYMNSKVLINGQLVQYFSGVSSGDIIVTGTRVMESLSMSYIFLFIAIIMTGVFISKTYTEVTRLLTPDLGGDDLFD